MGEIRTAEGEEERVACLAEMAKWANNVNSGIPAPFISDEGVEFALYPQSDSEEDDDLHGLAFEDDIGGVFEPTTLLVEKDLVAGLE